MRGIKASTLEPSLLTSELTHYCNAAPLFPILSSSQSPLPDLTISLRSKVYVQGGCYNLPTLPNTQVMSISCKILDPDIGRSLGPFSHVNGTVFHIYGGSSASHPVAGDQSSSLSTAPAVLISTIIPEDESDASSPFSHLGRCSRTVQSGGGMSQGHHPLSVLLMGTLRRSSGARNKMSLVHLWH